MSVVYSSMGSVSKEPVNEKTIVAALYDLQIPGQLAFSGELP
jgi:hypothetical protein